MTSWLKQSTAVSVILGPFIDDTDGKTAKTGLTVTSMDVDLYKGVTKSDLTITASGGDNDMAHVANGYYSLELTTGNTDTLGRLRLTANITAALAVWRDFLVLPANVYDSLVAGSDKLAVHADEITNGLITAAAIATGAIDADAIATDAVTEIQSGLATAAALATVDDFLDTEIAAILADTNELQTDWANGGRLDLLIDAIKAKTDNLPADPADDSDIDAQLATIAGYLDTEVAAILADTNELQTDWVNGGRLDLLIDAIKAKTDNLPADPADQSAVEAAITAAASPLATAASIAALNDLSAADVNAQVVDVLATDTFAEPGAVPAATSSLKDKIGWLFMLARNKRTTTATTDAVRNDADSSNVATSTLSDDGSTFTRGEYS